MSSPDPLLVIAVCGLVASGKSHVARALAEQLGAEHIEGDRLRDELIGTRPGGDVDESRLLRSFGALFGQQGYAELRRRAERTIESGRAVVIDACFPLASHREGVRSLARRTGHTLLFVECCVDDRTTRTRLAERDARAERPGWNEVAQELARSWEPLREMAESELLVLDTARPVEQTVAEVVAHIDARRPTPLPPADGRPRAEAVTFDCWNTLIFEPSWPKAHAERVASLARSAEEAGRSVSLDDAGTAFDAAWERHMRLWSEGVASGAREVAVWALAELGLREPHPALEHLVRSFEEASHSHAVEALAGAGETLERLARAGVRRALVCDTGLTPGRVVRRHLERAGLLELLEVQVFSDEIGVPKPDPRAFQAALEPLDVEPTRALHVGDLRRTDVAGARGFGMCSARISARHDDTTALPEADYVVGSHAELWSLLTDG